MVLIEKNVTELELIMAKNGRNLSKNITAWFMGD